MISVTILQSHCFLTELIASHPLQPRQLLKEKQFQLRMPYVSVIQKGLRSNSGVRHRLHVPECEGSCLLTRSVLRDTPRFVPPATPVPRQPIFRVCSNLKLMVSSWLKKMNWLGHSFLTEKFVTGKQMPQSVRKSKSPRREATRKRGQVQESRSAGGEEQRTHTQKQTHQQSDRGHETPKMTSSVSPKSMRLECQFHPHPYNQIPFT